MNFKDHFSKHASTYAIYRPKSPKLLFQYLASLVHQRKVAWDVGTGNGQAALELTPYFEKIIATDPSEAQIKHAVLHSKIEYRVEKAEKSRIRDHEIDLVTVAQAFHWFDFEPFFGEVRRVATPGAIIAVWTYGLARIEPRIDALVMNYYDTRVGKCWPPERKWVDDHYVTIPFPFEGITTPGFEMLEQRDLAEWCGYVFTWSATQKAIKELGPKIFDDLVLDLEKEWGNANDKKNIKWPLYLRVGRVNGC